jgi:putative aldouronate transport system permease protein
MRQRKSIGENIFDSLIYISVTLAALTCLYPMLHVVFSSLSDGEQLYFHYGPVFYPLGFSFHGYNIILVNPSVWTGYGNTLIYVIVGTSINMFLSTIGAYVLSRPYYRLKVIFTVFVVLTMYIYGGMIPNFILVKNLNMLDTRWALLLPNAVLTWNLIIMKTSFQGVPHELEEAAIIDGAGHGRLMTQIVIPVSKATIAVMVLFYAVFHWNSWFHAMIYLQNRDLYPLQLILRELLVSISDPSSSYTGTTGVDYWEDVVLNATIVVATVPILFIYPFIQRYFVKGVMVGSLKG